MIVFLGDSFTWGQGLYFEKWESDGIDVNEWKGKYGDLSYYPHESLNFQSDSYRRNSNFSSIVAKYYDRFHNSTWGNGGSNWELLQQISMLPIISPNTELVVVQLTDWSRNDGKDIFSKELNDKIKFKHTSYNEIIDSMVLTEITYQIKKVKELCDSISKKWICISWRDDMGKILKEKYPENYIPFFYKNKEYYGFEVALNDNEYTLHRFNDGHFNSKGHKLVAESIIKKIEEIGGRNLFNYII